MCCNLHQLGLSQKNQWLNASPDCTHACTDLQGSHIVLRMIVKERSYKTRRKPCAYVHHMMHQSIWQQHSQIQKGVAAYYEGDINRSSWFPGDTNSSTMLQCHIHHNTRMTGQGKTKPLNKWTPRYRRISFVFKDRSAFPPRARPDSSLVSRQLRMCKARGNGSQGCCVDVCGYVNTIKYTYNQGVSFWVHWLHASWPCRRLCWWPIPSCCVGPPRCDPL